MKASEFAARAEAYLGTPYSELDCSGLLHQASGGTVYHGSNTIWRTGTVRRGSISDHGSGNGYPRDRDPLTSGQLRTGMAVFKWNAKDVKGDGLGDYQHVGVVTGTNPLVITHSSSEKGCVTQDRSIGKWCAWAMLRGIDYEEETMEEQNTGKGSRWLLTVKARTLRIRGAATTAAAQTGSMKLGETAEADALENGWYHLTKGGYVSARYVSAAEVQDGTLEDRVTELERRVAALEAADGE